MKVYLQLRIRGSVPLKTHVFLERDSAVHGSIRMDMSFFLISCAKDIESSIMGICSHVFEVEVLYTCLFPLVRPKLHRTLLAAILL
jgi:hypothetical protein